MPERQPSPDEVTQRPTSAEPESSASPGPDPTNDAAGTPSASGNGTPTDGDATNGSTTNGAPDTGVPRQGPAADRGNGAAGNGAAAQAPATDTSNGAAGNGAPAQSPVATSDNRSATTGSAGAARTQGAVAGEAASTPETADLADQVAEQVATDPVAAEPAAAEPGEAPPAQDEPLLSGKEAAELADPAAPDAASASADAARGSTPSPRPRPRTADDAVAAAEVTPAVTEPEAAGPAADAPKSSETRTAPTTAAPGASGSAASGAAAPGAAGADNAAQAAPAGGAARPASAGKAGDARGTGSTGADAGRGGYVDSPTVRAALPAAAASGSAAAAPGAQAPGSPNPAATGAENGDGASAAAATTWFNSWDAEATQVIPVRAKAATTPSEQPTQQMRAPGAVGPVDPPTEQIQLPVAGSPPPTAPGGSGAGADEPPRRRNRRLLIGAAVVALLAAIYIVDLLISMGSVPRGISVAGVQIGGLSRGDAEQRLRSAIEPRSTQPVIVTAGEVQSEIDPRTAGLEVDWRATLEQAGSQSLNPITRITSFFTDREVGVVNTADERSVTTALEQLGPVVDREPTEGSVRFEGLTPVPVEPENGQQLDLPAAVQVLERDWASGQPVVLPLISTPPATTMDDVRQAIETVATPAVAAPVTVNGEGAQATLTPDAIASALSFRADPAASPKLVPEINEEAITAALKPQLAGTVTPSRDATLDFSSGTPVITPSQDGRGIDYDATLGDLLRVLTQPSPRQITAVYADQPAEVTTEDINSLGIVGEISSFTTGGFAADSGQNIKRAAEQIDGTIVEPGETFSLNAATNPRNAANGYVEAGIISDGHPDRGIGGGVSQVATTLYNAAYFAGMVDVEHREHSFYISRYPVAREATVYNDVIDVKFRNDGPTGVLIQTIWTPSSLTVKMFGTKRYEVTSATGPRTNPTSPNTVTIPAGRPCAPSQGAPGFTATDTRTLRDVQTGETRSETRTVKYNPSPIVVCGG
ncbi:VanW family protein [Pseudonocardia sp. H11422]|uniref:VanW family protein n=1 Tax=Pseudonocardia sp. H11422 TaxID=2835866 RepID=UPI001BDC5E80|nr:VanW family protein [Pseudonocardia sp. H11422]